MFDIISEIEDEILSLHNVDDHNVGDPIEGDGHMLESVQDEAVTFCSDDMYSGFSESAAAQLVKSWAAE